MIVMVTQHIPNMTKSHHGGEVSVMKKVGMCQCQKPTIHHDELYIGLYMYQVTHITSGSFGMNFQIESATESGSDTHLVFVFVFYIYRRMWSGRKRRKSFILAHVQAPRCRSRLRLRTRCRRDPVPAECAA